MTVYNTEQCCIHGQKSKCCKAFNFWGDLFFIGNTVL